MLILISFSFKKNTVLELKIKECFDPKRCILIKQNKNQYFKIVTRGPVSLTMGNTTLP